MTARRPLILFALLWTFALVAGSLMPISFKVALHTSHEFIHTALHVGGFAVLSSLLATLANSRFAYWLLLIASISLGVALELLEVATYHSPLEFSDIGLDAFGCGIGFLAVIWLARLRAI